MIELSLRCLPILADVRVDHLRRHRVRRQRRQRRRRLSRCQRRWQTSAL